MRTYRLLPAALFAGIAAANSASAAVNFSVIFDDGGAFSSRNTLLEQNIMAAGAAWAGHLQGDADIEIVVRTGAPRVAGRSLMAMPIGNDGGYDVYEQGMSHEIRTGFDPNGASIADVEISMSPWYVENMLWLSSDPASGHEEPPADRVDAVSVFMHELGHALGFNGWRDRYNGSLPGLYMSTFDQHIMFEGDRAFFTGEQAMDVYGGPVPLTYGNIFHLGNAAPHPGSDLLDDLMTGVVFEAGEVYEISDLDLAIMADIGAPVLLPAPGAAGVLALGGLAVLRRRRG